LNFEDVSQFSYELQQTADDFKTLGQIDAKKEVLEQEAKDNIKQQKV